MVSLRNEARVANSSRVVAGHRGLEDFSLNSGGKALTSALAPATAS